MYSKFIAIILTSSLALGASFPTTELRQGGQSINNTNPLGVRLSDGAGWLSALSISQPNKTQTFTVLASQGSAQTFDFDLSSGITSVRLLIRGSIGGAGCTVTTYGTIDGATPSWRFLEGRPAGTADGLSVVTVPILNGLGNDSEVTYNTAGYQKLQFRAGTCTGGATTLVATGAHGAVPFSELDFSDKYSKITTDAGVVGGIDDGSGLGVSALKVAMAGTHFVVSSSNSTTSQLAAGATFTGAIETVFNQQAASLLLTSDKKGTLTVRQYIDSAGTRKISEWAYKILPNVPFSRAFQVNGNYFNLSFQNEDLTTTTTLRIDTAYGTLPSVTNNGNGPVALDEVAGTALTDASIRPDAVLRVAQDSSSLFYDGYDAALDTTDRWTQLGIAPTSGSGVLTINAGTAANAFSNLQSKPSFPLLGNMFNHGVFIARADSGFKIGAYRFLGFGVIPGTPTAAAPLTSGVGFEWDATTGKLFAAVWSGGARIQQLDLSAFQPTDGNYHRFAVYFRTSKAFFEIDNTTVGTISFPNPSASSLPLAHLVVNGASTVSPAATFQISFSSVGDTAKNNTAISDGLLPWRKATVSSDLAMVVKQRSEINRVQKHFTAIYTGTTAEGMLNLIPTNNGVASAAATTHSVTAGKTLRIESICVNTKNAGAAGQGTVVNLRMNPTGAVTTSSPLLVSVATGTGLAVANIASGNCNQFPNGIELTGAMQIGASQSGTATAGNTITIHGYEY